MLQYTADENFNLDIVREVRRRNPLLDIRRAQEAGLAGADDPAILAWAAREHRVLVTHDFKTMLPEAHRRVAAGLPMPGVFAARWGSDYRPVIEDLLVAAGASLPNEREGRVVYLPF